MAKSLAFVKISSKQPFRKSGEVLFSEIQPHKYALSGLIGRFEFIYYIAA